MSESNPNDLIKAAEEVLSVEAPPVEERPAVPLDLIEQVEVVIEEGPQVQSNLSRGLQTIPANSADLINASFDDEAPAAPSMNVNAFQKFGDLPSHLRENEGINLVEVKKLNLAVAVEALERALQAHENFPSPDAGFAVANLSDQVQKLTKDLEKSQDPQKILDDILENALSVLTREIIQDLAQEMKKLREETLSMVRDQKKEAFDLAFKVAVNRMGPAMKERLEVARSRIARALNVKEKPNDRSGN